MGKGPRNYIRDGPVLFMRGRGWLGILWGLNFFHLQIVHGFFVLLGNTAPITRVFPAVFAVEYEGRNRHNIECFFEGVLYSGWPNQPSSGTMGILRWDVFLCSILLCRVFLSSAGTWGEFQILTNR